MIIRLIAIDPRPRNGESDVVVYQVSEHSRAFELLCELLTQENIEWTTLAQNPKPLPVKCCAVHPTTPDLLCAREEGHTSYHFNGEIRWANEIPF